MKIRKYLGLLLALMMCLSLIACGGNESGDDLDDAVGSDWRTTGITQSAGTITRNGEDTFVLVCVSAEDAAFYYDLEDQVLFDFVDYPIVLEGDPWEMFRNIDFADRTGDGNSDVAIMFEKDGGTILMVWFWDKESDSFVFQPEESQLATEEDTAA